MADYVTGFGPMPGAAGQPPAATPAGGTGVTDRAAMRAAAEGLETLFLAEMLKTAGLGKTPDSFGGGVGEDQFASFLTEAQAGRIVAAGGIGLAESLFNSMLEARDGRD
ncbi:rod-binding protein [Pseudoroseicyclus aestuarii]|uniref:Rod binding protein n=1 Tax=Pseudoroseicyclus aestuarii TaxID=1795041 RepID=A0A318SW37_9RHOB|nr:rod binding protein [Pseudoroseicyclus aestuarii]